VVAKLNSDVDPTLWQTSDEAQAAYVLMPMRV
jgi:DNA polymerase III sliding clamp (beta) subunit (PCNA family)